MIVDLFAGGGGASEGIRLALGRDPDVAVNHSPEAIAMHLANHPGTRHFVEDVFDVNPRAVCGDRPVELLWMSPDCTHFSRAKGGKPREKGTRSLAWVAIRWAAEVRPAVIALENVAEFATWGPLCDAGQPDDRALRTLGAGWVARRDHARCDGDEARNEAEEEVKDAWIQVAELLYAMPREERIRILVATTALMGLEKSVAERLRTCGRCGGPVVPVDLDGPAEPTGQHSGKEGAST